MDRQRQLQLLYEEARRLYREGIDEATAYDRLHADQRFSIAIQRSDIQKLYIKFQENNQLKAEQDQLERSMVQIYKKRELLSARHYMMKFDRQNAKKHLISKDVKSKFSDSFLNFWQGRYALGYVKTPDMPNHTFEIFDMFHQQLRQVTAPSHGRFVEIYALADPFLLFIEVSPDNATYYVSLVKFEPGFDSMQVVQTIQRPNHVQIYVDSIDPKKFIIQNYVRVDGGNENFTMQLYKLINGQIELGKEVEYHNGGKLLSYFDGNLYSFVQRRNENDPIAHGLPIFPGFAHGPVPQGLLPIGLPIDGAEFADGFIDQEQIDMAFELAAERPMGRGIIDMIHGFAGRQPIAPEPIAQERAEEPIAHELAGENPIAQERAGENPIAPEPIAQAPGAARPMMQQRLFDFRLQSANMQIFDLEQNKNTIVDMNPFPTNVEETLQSSFSLYPEYAWMQNCCFVSVKFKQSKNFGIAFANAETQNWTVLGIAFKFRIRHLQLVNAGLMVHANKEREIGEENGDGNNVKDKIYKFPMRKPDRLRCMAWQKHIKFIKESTGAENPHEAALPYLPYNSDVQPFRRIN